MDDAPPDGHSRVHVQRAPHLEQRLLRLRALGPVPAVPLHARAREDLEHEQRDTPRARVQDILGAAEVYGGEGVHDLQQHAWRAKRVWQVQMPRESNQ